MSPEPFDLCLHASPGLSPLVLDAGTPECETCHECHKRKDIPIPAVLTCGGLIKKRVLWYLGNVDFFSFLLTKQKLLWGSF